MTEDTDEALDDAIRAAGLRATRQRRAIFRALSGAEDHPDAVELHARARAIDPTVSLATVYRTLAALSAKGMINRLDFEGAATRFETADAPHHDHIVDLDSGEIVEFVSPEIEALQRRIAEAHGYEIISHRLELYCRKR